MKTLIICFKPTLAMMLNEKAADILSNPSEYRDSLELVGKGTVERKFQTDEEMESYKMALEDVPCKWTNLDERVLTALKSLPKEDENSIKL